MMTRARLRLTFLLLLLANAVFFVYLRFANAPDDAAAQIQRLQLHPERIKLIGTGDALKKLSLPGQPDARPSHACLEWGLFAGPAVARADAAISALNLPADAVERAIVDSGAYWVYVPPVKTKAEVERTTQELRTRQVADFFLVQDPPQWRNAISLGIFQTEESANVLLGTLRDKGVHNAIMERRENFLKQVAYFMREPSVALVARLAELQREFPGSEVKAAPCPPSK